jgi:hypothetical protein
MRMSVEGHSRRSRAASKPGHVRYAAESGSGYNNEQIARVLAHGRTCGRQSWRVRGL